jgi:hypothetical protein
MQQPSLPNNTVSKRQQTEEKERTKKKQLQ